MKIIILDGNKIKNTKHFHKAFIKALDLPRSYGKNLDALNDVLTSAQEEIGIIAVNTSLLSEALGTRWQSFLQLMEDVDLEKSNIHFTIPF
ncbi:MAG: barstar family protein [Clostridia bacterium]|nr:barstar family protein [Clostridia bacterium]